jgi:hypothetical protein
MAAIGPCMFLAPLVFVLAILALPLWPVALVVLAVLFVVLWPIEQLATRLGARWFAGKSGAVGHAFLVVARPWRYLPKQPGAKR